MTLPNFFIIGAPKAGTTSLYDYLRAHPEVFMPIGKGPRYFCYSGQKDKYNYRFTTLAEYEALFDDVTDEKAIGEATALYFEHRSAARRIQEVIPDPRLIAILREPVERAFSIYHMNLRNFDANKGLGFLEALRADRALRRMYVDGLAPFYEAFGRERIRVIRFDDLKRDALGTVRGLFEFLGVRPDFVPDLAVSNPGGIPRSMLLHKVLNDPRLRLVAQKLAPEAVIREVKNLRNRNLVKHRMTEEERAGAYAFFHDDILRTQDLTGLDLSGWLR